MPNSQITIKKAGQHTIHSVYDCIEFIFNSLSGGILSNGTFAKARINIFNTIPENDTIEVFGELFTSKATPDNSGNQFQSTTPTLQAQEFLKALNDNYYISSNFYCYINPAANNTTAIDIIAYKKGPDYTLNVVMGTSSANAQLVSQFPGNHFLLQDNYALYVKVLIGISNLYQIDDLTVDPRFIYDEANTGNPPAIEFIQQLQSSLRGYAVSRRLKLNNGSVSIGYNGMVPYKLKYGDAHGNPRKVKALNTSPQYWAINADFDWCLDTDIEEYLNGEKYLTVMPHDLKACPDSNIFLSFIVKAAEGEEWQLEISATKYPSAEVVLLHNVSGTGTKMVDLPVGPAQIALCNGNQIVSEPEFAAVGNWLNLTPTNWSIAGGKATISKPTTAFSADYLYQAVTFEQGKMYRVEIEVVDYIDGELNFRVWDGQSMFFTHTGIKYNGEYSFIIDCTNATKDYNEFGFWNPYFWSTCRMGLEYVRIYEIETGAACTDCYEINTTITRGASIAGVNLFNSATQGTFENGWTSDIASDADIQSPPNPGTVGAGVYTSNPPLPDYPKGGVKHFAFEYAAYSGGVFASGDFIIFGNNSIVLEANKRYRMSAWIKLIEEHSSGCNDGIEGKIQVWSHDGWSDGTLTIVTEWDNQNCIQNPPQPPSQWMKLETILETGSDVSGKMGLRLIGAEFDQIDGLFYIDALEVYEENITDNSSLPAFNICIDDCCDVQDFIFKNRFGRYDFIRLRENRGVTLEIEDSQLVRTVNCEYSEFEYRGDVVQDEMVSILPTNFDMGNVEDYGCEDGGLSDISTKSHKILRFTSDWIKESQVEYYLQFLNSPERYIIENGKYRKVIRIGNSYTLYQKAGKVSIEFTCRYSHDLPTVSN